MKGQHTLNYTWTQLQTFLCPFIFAISKCFALITPLNSAQQLAALVCSSAHSLSPLAPASILPCALIRQSQLAIYRLNLQQDKALTLPLPLCRRCCPLFATLCFCRLFALSFSLSFTYLFVCVCECLAQPSTNCDSIPFGAEQSPPVPAVHHWQHNCLAPVSPQQLERKSALLALSPHERPIQLASDLTRGRFSLSFFLFLHLCLYYFASFAVLCILFFVVCRKISSPLPVAVN